MQQHPDSRHPDTLICRGSIQASRHSDLPWQHPDSSIQTLWFAVGARICGRLRGFGGAFFKQSSGSLLAHWARLRLLC